jgi:hypothetical protein
LNTMEGAIALLSAHPAIAVLARDDPHEPDVLLIITTQLSDATLCSLELASVSAGRPPRVVVVVERIGPRQLARVANAGVFSLLDRRTSGYDRIAQEILAARAGRARQPARLGNRPWGRIGRTQSGWAATSPRSDQTRTAPARGEVAGKRLFDLVHPGKGVANGRKEAMTESLSPQENPAKDPADWVTGDEPMTGPQKSYLQTLAREAGRDVALDGMSKADASRLIDELQAASGRGVADS